MFEHFFAKADRDQLLSAFKSHDTKTFVFQLMKNPDLFNLLVINVLLMLAIMLEFAAGIFLGGFHLIIDGLHNILHVLALSFSLIATVVARLPRNQRFTYGYSRLEIISAFTNCCFLVFLSLFLAFRSIHDLLDSLDESGEHHHKASDKGHDLLELFNLIRICIHLFGVKVTMKFSVDPLLLFNNNIQPGHSQQVNKKDARLPHLESSLYVNLYTIHYHFLISLFKATAFVCLHYFAFLQKLDMEFFFTLALLIFTIAKTKNIFVLTTDIMLQGMPQGFDKSIPQLLDRVKNVVSISEVHYWSLDPSQNIIYLHVKLKSIKEKSATENEIRGILQGSFADILIEASEENV